MEDIIVDECAFIIDSCQYSSSQNDILLHSHIAREVETFENIDGEMAVYDEPDVDEPVEGSPLVHCSGKVVIEGEDEASEVVFEGDVRVKVARPLRCVAPDGGEVGEGRLGFEEGGGGVVEDMSKSKSEFEGGEVVEDEEDEENVERRNEGGGEIEVVGVGDEKDNGVGSEDVMNLDTVVIGVEEEIVEEDCEVGVFEFDTSVIGCEEEDGKVGVDEDVLRGEGGRVSEEGMTGRKRKLPRSVFERWGEGLGDGEGCLEDAGMKVVEEKEDNGDENGKCEVDKEGALREEGSRMSEDNITTNKRKLYHIMFEQRGGLENGEGCSKDVRTNVVGADDEQGNYAKVDGEMSDVSVEEIVLKEREENRHQYGKKVSGKEGSRLSKEEMAGGTRKLPCSKDASQDGNGKSEEGEASIKFILDLLKLLVGNKSNDEEVDLLETAKRRGMTFPSPRFRP
ncbi:hypothetical protein vseg_006425 [Gypsophila vaccaria]